mgnify:CR=1 FL=1
MDFIKLMEGLPYRELNKTEDKKYLCVKILGKRNSKGSRQVLMCLKGNDGELFASWIDNEESSKFKHLLEGNIPESKN